VNSISRPTPGFGLVLILVSLVLCAAAWLAIDRPVHFTERGAAMDFKSRADWPDMRINVNAASAAELSVLPGLGPALAQRIVDDRAARGPFKSVDDLDRVKGIGKAIVERLRPYAVAEQIPTTR
jgi:competence protein ComEA